MYFLSITIIPNEIYIIFYFQTHSTVAVIVSVYFVFELNMIFCLLLTCFFLFRSVNGIQKTHYMSPRKSIELQFICNQVFSSVLKCLRFHSANIRSFVFLRLFFAFIFKIKSECNVYTLVNKMIIILLYFFVENKLYKYIVNCNVKYGQTYLNRCDKIWR